MQSLGRSFNLRWGMALLAITVALVTPRSALATFYTVNRSFSQNGNIATLVGTVGVANGSYTIENSSPSPFTSVNLTLTVAGTPYTVDNVVTALIFGTGQFSNNATSTTLTFSTANFNGFNPADLEFLDATGTNAYIIGSDGSPDFQVANTAAGKVIDDSMALPTVFGVAAVPEPSTMRFAGVMLAIICSVKLFRKLQRVRHVTSTVRLNSLRQSPPAPPGQPV